MPSLRILLLTFNCARNFVDPEILATDILDAIPETPTSKASRIIPDVIAVSLQEVAPIAYAFLGGPYLTPYLARVGAAVHLASERYAETHQERQTDNVAPEDWIYTNVITKNVGLTALMIFARRKVADSICWITWGSAGVGVGGMGNKGAVGIRLGFDAVKVKQSVKDWDEDSGVSVLEVTFVAVHLAPNAGNVERRNQDWENIVRNLVFLPEEAFVPNTDEPFGIAKDTPRPKLNFSIYGKNDSSETSAALHFVFGDLNYRTGDEDPDPDSYMAFPQPTQDISSLLHYSRLLTKDQLNAERAENRTLHSFEELDVTFPPTYKYDPNQHWPGYENGLRVPNTTGWLWEATRWPSWCDRILFLPQEPLTVEKYVSLPVQPTSDHRPVALSATVNLSKTLGKAMEVQEGPFPLNPDWEGRRRDARMKEVVVGGLSWFVLTTEGRIWFSGLTIGGLATLFAIIALLKV
ncbi:DNase I-like protein [Eremomyces bilateralis CBS 781.70]|uniref:DNase I-like protein n=1 Tax=Eremomyces bilateralis CBS 781.70 TaxID=1392243 RepID=A0A6G1GET7_9PEZI|nr:DNase I-like protein [Eremomyces bilateralis CBS 781.70]KAF1816544.1 DNase I-like protein [Eremomyces bilateralis CBS 781.70]